MSRNRKGFPEKSFVLVTGNSPLNPFIATKEFAAQTLYMYFLFVVCLFVCLIIFLSYLYRIRIILLLEKITCHVAMHTIVPLL